MPAWNYLNTTLADQRNRPKGEHFTSISINDLLTDGNIEEKTKFRSATEGRRGLAPEQLHAILNRITARWKMNGDEVIMVRRFAGLPARIRQDAFEEGRYGRDIEGAFHNGKTYLIAEQLSSEIDARDGLPSLSLKNNQVFQTCLNY